MSSFRPAGRDLNLSDFDFSGVQVTGHTQGTGNNLGAAWANIRKNSPNYQNLEMTGMQTRAEEKATAMAAESQVYGAEVGAIAGVKAAEAQADAMKEAAQKQAQGSMMGSALGAVGSIASAFLSDESTKHDIVELEDSLSVLRKLRPVSFYYNKEYSWSPERLHHGFIAQEYKEVLPDAVYQDHVSGKMCIDTHELIAHLVRANQQLETRVTRLEAANVLQKVPQGVK